MNNSTSFARFLIAVVSIGPVAGHTISAQGPPRVEGSKEVRESLDREAKNLTRRAIRLQNGSPSERKQGPKLRKEILELTRERLGPEHPGVIEAITELASAYGIANQYREAARAQREALELSKKVYPRDGWPNGAVTTAKCTVRLAQYHMLLRELDQFDQLINQADRILSEASPPVEFDLAETRTDMGFLFMALRDVKRARQYCLEATELVGKLKSIPDGRENNLAVIYSKCAWVFGHSLEPAKGKRLALRALAITEHLPASETHAQTLRCLGNLCRDLGEYDEAVTYFDRAYQLFEAAQIEEAGKLAVETASCYVAMGQIDVAEEWLERAERYPTIQAPIQNQLHYIRGHVLLNQGKVNAASERFKSALQATDLRSQDVRTVSQVYESLGGVAAVKGRPAEAAKLFETALTLRADKVTEFMASAGEAYALALLADYRAVSEKYLRVTRTQSSSEQVRRQYSLVLRQRGLAGRVVALRNRLRRDLTGEAADVYRKYISTANQLASPSTSKPGADVNERVRLVERKEYLDQQLTELVPDLVGAIRRLRVSLDLVQRSLAGGEQLVDFVRYKNGDQYSYAVFVLTREQLQRVDLDDADSIELAVREWRTSLVAGKYDQATARRLYDRVWRPIEQYFAKWAQTIHLCADGILCRLPWNALIDDEGKALIEHYLITRPPYPHAIVKSLRTSRSKTNQFLAVGNIDYGSFPAQPEPESSGSRLPAWRPLTYSAQEISDAAELAKAMNARVERLDRDSATADSVVNAMRSSKWIHIATHGFFKRDSRQYTPSHNPLTECGLVMAHANVARNDRQSIINGAMICHLDLDATELVFLSACQSGLGQVFDGEGAFGLQRAFHHAGVSNVVCSLWPIDDAATATLVQIFWKNYWSNGRSAATALRDAQLEIYNNPLLVEKLAATRGMKLKLGKPTRRQRKSPPRLWAGFVCSGTDVTRLDR